MVWLIPTLEIDGQGRQRTSSKLVVGFSSFPCGDGGVWNIPQGLTNSLPFQLDFLTCEHHQNEDGLFRFVGLFGFVTQKHESICVVNPHLSALSPSRHRQDDHRRVDDLWLVEAFFGYGRVVIARSFGLAWVGRLRCS